MNMHFLSLLNAKIILTSDHSNLTYNRIAAADREFNHICHAAMYATTRALRPAKANGCEQLA